MAILLLASRAISDTCLILPFENQTKNANLEWISESFSEGLSDILAGPSLHVATREERATAFDHLGIPAASILSRASIIKLAETMDADCIVFGQYSLADRDQLQASAQVLELRAPKLSSRLTESGPLRDLLVIQDRLGVSLSRALGAGQAQGLPGGLAPVPKSHVPLDAWENYIRGLTASSKPQQIKFFREAARLAPAFTHPALRLGKIYLEDRDYTTAIPWLSKVKSDENGFLEATFLLGIAHFFQSDYAKAEAAFKVVAERVPLGEAYNNLGAALSRRNRSSALESFRKAAESDPADVDYQFNVGYWHWKTGQYAAAIRRMRLVLERRANDPEARALLVKALERAGNVAEAARERELLARSPAGARLANGDDKLFEGLERIKRNYDEVSFRQFRLTLEALAEESLSRQPAERHAEAHLERGRELFLEQNDPAALPELQEAARLDPSRAETHLLLARLHERAGRQDEAIREANLVLAAQKSVDAHLLLAKIFLEKGRLPEARQHAEQALEVEPENIAARSVLKTIEMRTP